ncbi:PilW family protein [Xylophilus sp. GOD-11R]|uniref:PilW family protein n=1 Tax=Xylophilus sp. GOD-11R TaxID=3089814 RepID=UPI00298C2D9D|nr:PilW family protein [Xylophilus sp. GOD-11R]WPB59302.1 PilW family protein [Xylophilus sp. GOD-11R]
MGGAMLADLMVGIALGLMVVIVAIASLFATLSAAAAARDAADLQQRADTALRLIGDEVRRAGSVRFSLPDAPSQFSHVFQGWNNTGLAVSGTEGGPGASDTLRLSYEPGTDDRDCLGYHPADSNHVDSEFQIGIESINAGRPALYCKGSGGAKISWQALVSGVDDLQVLYAIADPDGKIAYVGADKIDTTSRVLAVSICLQLSSEGRRGAGSALGCDGKPIAAPALADRIVFVARGIFRVRNAEI